MSDPSSGCSTRVAYELTPTCARISRNATTPVRVHRRTRLHFGSTAISAAEVKAATALASSGDGTVSAQDVDLTSRAMHTSGTVGAGNDKIVVVLTLEPTTLSWQDSAGRITELTRDVYLKSAL